MRSLISVLEAKVGKKEADNAREVLGKVLSDRQNKASANKKELKESAGGQTG
jgi:hypothetical protein